MNAVRFSHIFSPEVRNTLSSSLWVRPPDRLTQILNTCGCTTCIYLLCANIIQEKYNIVKWSHFLSSGPRPKFNRPTILIHPIRGLSLSFIRTRPKTIILKFLSCFESERCVSSIWPGEGSNWNWEPIFPVSGAGGEDEGES